MSFLWILATFFIWFIIFDMWFGFEDYRTLKTRKHFGRPGFSCYADKDGLHINSGPNPDHATRCQNYARDNGSQIPLYLFLMFIEALIYSIIVYVGFGVLAWLFF